MKKFVIGDRLKDEWISVLDTENKKLEFTNHLASAKEFTDEDFAKAQLKELQTTGYFSDLQIYLLDGNKAYKPGERDSFQL
jgi:L-lysine 2,3-aminomutase